MKSIELDRLHPVDKDEWLGRFAEESDVNNLVSEDTIVKVKSRTVLVYFKNSGMDLEPLRKSLGKLKFAPGFRATNSAAFKSNARVFGYMPRLELRNKPCRISSLANDDVRSHQLLEQWTSKVAEVYRDFAPEAAELHKAQTQEKVREEFHLAKSMFTSGIVNKSSQLPYHFDSGNFKGAWSAMLGLKQYVKGGYLVIPAYDIALEISDGSLSFFDGQQQLHGVTPIKRINRKGERYTVVWYSLQKLWSCLTAKEELALVNQRATNNAKKKAKRKK